MEIIHPSEIVGERFNDARDFVQKAIESRNHWKALYGLAPICKSYARGDFEIHLYLSCLFNLRSPITEVENKGIIFEWINITNYCIRIQRHTYLELTSATNTPLKGCANRPSAKHSNEAMLVGIVQLLKKKNGALPTSIPSLVWLKSLNACPISPMNALQQSQAVSCMPELGDYITVPIPPISMPDKIDRKGSSTIGFRGVFEGKLPSQEVKSRTEIVNNLSNDNSPLVRECGGILNPDVLVSSFSIELGQDNTIGIFFEEPLKSSLQGYELFFYPLDLNSWPIEWVHGKTIQQNGRIV